MEKTAQFFLQWLVSTFYIYLPSMENISTMVKWIGGISAGENLLRELMSLMMQGKALQAEKGLQMESFSPLLPLALSNLITLPS